ncbi:MAG: TolC family protein [Candidatus Zixiibacteriota bacterium]
MSTIRFSGFGVKPYCCLVVVTMIGLFSGAAYGLELTLQQAIEMATTHTSRARIIRGDLEVAQQKYFSERINFVLPSISINGSLPAFSADEAYRLYGGLRQKTTIKQTDLDFRSNIQLEQSLITGGRFTARANLFRNRSEYPLWDSLSLTVDQTTRQGFYELEFEQPLLRPSNEKHELHNKRDDLALARIDKQEQVAEVQKEVVEAYVGTILAKLTSQIAQRNLESARLRFEIDSVQMQDGVISEEELLTSHSDLLDAELDEFEAANKQGQQDRELALLLDVGAAEEILPADPDVPEPLSPSERTGLIGRWEESAMIMKAQVKYDKEKRTADFAASGHGLSGDLRASYSLGRGSVKTTGEADDEIKTNSWGLSLNFTYPLWDGGSSGAVVKASYLKAEKSLLELERAKRTAQYEIADLVSRMDVGHRKIGLLKKQIDIALDRLDIAKFRFDDGQISRIALLDAEVDHLKSRRDFLEELEKYYLDSLSLDAMFAN